MLKSLTNLFKRQQPPEQKNGTEPAPLVPLLVFRDTTCVPVTRIEEDNLLVFHPQNGTDLLTRIPLGQEESSGFFIKPKLTNPALLRDKTTQSYQQALLDPLLRTLPYVLETYRILESCYRRPAYRIMEPVGTADQGYLLKFYCQEAFGNVSGQITARVLFCEARAYFTSPVMTELKNAISQIFLLKNKD